ncbi:putative MAGE domain, U6 snRNA phosphodiesterase Usb1 [Plasmopara halstedii]
MKRRREEATQRSKRSRHQNLADSEDLSDDEVVPTYVAVADGSSDDEENGDINDNEEDDEAVLNFTQTNYTGPMSQEELLVGDIDDEGDNNKEPSKPKVLHKLSDKALDVLTSNLVRYIVYKGGLKLPFRFSDISKDVFPQYKNVSRYFFYFAKHKVERVFGYRVVHVDDRSGKEMYLVLNNASSQEHLLLMNKTGKAASRGFLMVILGLLWCAPARQLSEDELWKQLSRLDPEVKLKVHHPQLGDISQLFKTFESQLYLNATSELDADLKKIKYYQYGPRTYLEVSKIQILNFVCKDSLRLRRRLLKFLLKIPKFEFLYIFYQYKSFRCVLFHLSISIFIMESIINTYKSSSESSSEDDASTSSDSEVACSTVADAARAGVKRKRINESQWRRVFPHVDGNWPGHVRFDIALSQELHEHAKYTIELVQRVAGGAVKLVPFVQLDPHEDSSTEFDSTPLHMSLSRPFVLTYNQIGDFVDSLRAALKWRQRFRITLRHALVISNDAKTRSFLALQVYEGKQYFTQVLRCVDQCLAHFQLPTYYKNPIPHVSIASSLGNELTELSSDDSDRITNSEQRIEHVQIPRCSTIRLAAVQVAIGNKRYVIPLR